jgi:hypothetical protein
MPRDSPYPSASLGPIQGAEVYELASLILSLLPLGPDLGPLVSGLGTRVTAP